MRSSERRTSLRRAWIVTLAVLPALAACGSSTPGFGLAQAAPAVVEPACEVGLDRLSATQWAELRELHRKVERGPLFAAVAEGRVPSCAVAVDGSRWRIDYRFARDATLSVTRDSGIEYTELAARVNWAAGSDPRELLERIERASFTPSGCGIDWQKPEASSPAKQTWRGDVCNCQASVERDTAGHVVALGLRSAC